MSHLFKLGDKVIEKPFSIKCTIIDLYPYDSLVSSYPIYLVEYENGMKEFVAEHFLELDLDAKNQKQEEKNQIIIEKLVHLEEKVDKKENKTLCDCGAWITDFPQVHYKWCRSQGRGIW